MTLDVKNSARPIDTVVNCANAAPGTNRTFDIGFTIKAATSDPYIPWDNTPLPNGSSPPTDGRKIDYTNFTVP